MKLTRRAALAAVPSLLAPLPATARANAARVRKDVRTLKADDKDIVALQKAIAKMRDLDAKQPNNPLGWRKWAELHGKLNSDQTTGCKHENWFFLPWHRAYLHAFEEVVRKLSEYADFALPYWMWDSGKDEDHTIPTLFNGPIEAFKNPARPGAPNSGRQPANPKFTPRQLDGKIGKDYVAFVLTTDSFTGFAGKSPKEHEIGQLENGPHQFIHSWLQGDMKSAGAAYDPLFWLHHANVDRLWDRWAQTTGKNLTPNNETWLTEKFEFPQAEDKKLTLSVEQVLGGKLGYYYEGTKAAAEMKVSSAWQLRTASGALIAKAEDARPFAGGAAAVCRLPVTDVEKPYNELLNPKSRARVLRLRFSGFDPKVDPSLALEVYLSREEKNAELTPRSPGFVGTISFGPGWKHQADHPHTKRTLVLDGTAAFRRLYAKEPFPGKQSFVVQYFPVTISGEKWDGDARKVLPAETTVDVLYAEE